MNTFKLLSILLLLLISYVNTLREYNEDIDIINNIFNKLNIPKNYDFFKEKDDFKNPIIYGESQINCEPSWAIAATTALSYRYWKKGIKVALSPQYLLSCHKGNYWDDDISINSQFYLVKNGTVTEGCFPYTLDKGIFVDCPSLCKDGSELKKYFAINPYITPDINENNYYEIVKFIIDQIYNYGPVVAKTNVDSRYVVIVGFIFNKNRNVYQWEIQDLNGNDPIREIDFDLEIFRNIIISEPYIENDSDKGETISLTYEIDQNCDMKITTNNDKPYLKESFEYTFKNAKSSSIFYYQCGVIILPETKEKQINCFYDKNRLNYIEPGTYEYESCNGLGKDIIQSTNSPKFDYYGVHLIKGFTDKIYFSTYGKKFVLLYEKTKKDSIKLPDIYPNKNDNHILNCNYFKFGDVYLIYCTIKDDELKYFNYDSQNDEHKLFYNSLCGKKSSNIFAFKLDIKKYPVFNIKKLILPDYELYKNEPYCLFTFEGDIKGSLSNHNEKNIYKFGILIKIEMNNKDIIPSALKCQISSTSINKNDNTFKSYCTLELDQSFEKDPLQKKYCIKYNILPYFIPIEIDTPFEVIIPNNLEIINEYKKKGIEYDISKINNIFEDLGIPNSYSILDEPNFTKTIKNQGGCGSCWAMAVTTALSYRYFKKEGKQIDLSPQYLLSCYKKDCDGNKGLDPHLYLVSKGTVTEECFGYNSGMEK